MALAAEMSRAAMRRRRRSDVGRKWSRFFDDLTVPRIKEAEAWLRDAFQSEQFDGKTFVDIGCGGGLFSLAARRLGARVHAFDNDSGAVACARELRAWQCGDDPGWIVALGSILDRKYLASLGCFDFVHAWGVLHHTENFWEALENTKLLVSIGGRLVVSAAEDLGALSQNITRIKQNYARKRGPFAAVYALATAARYEWRESSDSRNRLTLTRSLQRWRGYDENSPRHVTRWGDWIAWISNHPYHCLQPDEIVDCCAQDGLQLIELRGAGGEPLSKEFLFQREAPAGQWVMPRALADRSIAHRYGSRVIGPYRRDELGVTGVVSKLPARTPAAKLWLARNGMFLKRVDILPGNRIRIPGANDPAEVAHWSLRVAAMEERPLSTPFTPVRGHMWEAPLTDLADDADFEKEASERSELLLLENGRQLLPPHAPHDEIARLGRGRYSHWGPALYFSASDGTDPNQNGRAYKALIPARPLPAERSCTSRFGGHVIRGPFVYTRDGWKGSAGPGGDLEREGMVYLFRDGTFIDGASIDRDGGIRLADPNEAWGQVHSSEFRLCRGQICELRPPFIHERGYMWSCLAPELASADAEDAKGLSPIFLFENDVQLPYPEAPRDEIAEKGHGRCAYSAGQVWFSTLDGSDPGQNGRQYRVFIGGTAALKFSGVQRDSGNQHRELRPVAYPGAMGAGTAAIVHELARDAAELSDQGIDFGPRVCVAEDPNAFDPSANPVFQSTGQHADPRATDPTVEHRNAADKSSVMGNPSPELGTPQEQAELLVRSGFFDPEWYRSRYPESVASGDPVRHYLTDEAAITHDPSCTFNSSIYLLIHPDAAASGSRPVLHYLHCSASTADPTLSALAGADADQQAALLRETGAVDAAWYLAANPDVAASGADPVWHYINEGAREGRNPHPHFDTRTYLLLYPEVAAAGINPLAHFLMANRGVDTDRRSGASGTGAGGPTDGNTIAEELVAVGRTGSNDQQINGGAGRIERLDPNQIGEDADFLWRVPLPADFGKGDSEDTPNASTLRLYEDTTALGPPHASHGEIRRRGKGALFTLERGIMVLHFGWERSADQRPDIPDS